MPPSLPTVPLDDHLLVRRADLESYLAAILADNRPHASANHLLRPAEVAERLGISRASVHILIARGALRSVRFGRAVRIHPEDLQQFINNRRQG